MRHSLLRTMSAVSMFLILIVPISLLGQSQNPRTTRHPREGRLRRGHSFHGDLRTLPQIPPHKFERPEREEPKATRTLLPGTQASGSSQAAPAQSAPTPSASAPAATNNFDGLDYASWGAGHPPDTNGDVGSTYYIQTINTSIGVYRKSDGVRVAAFTFNTFMSQGSFGNLCDTNNFGDPVVLYDTFEDRWIITDFAFQLDGSNNVMNPPGAFECFAVSKTGDPVSGGWNFFSIGVSGGLSDYPKLAVWPDGLYMSANMFGYPAGAAFQNARAWALNKAQMYANAPSVQVVSFDAPPADFAILPSNARLQTGTPPPGTPNYFLATWEFLNAVTVYKFHVDWASPLLSTLTGPETPAASTSWPNANVPNAPSQGGNALDVLQIRAMAQNQYTNLGGVESLWVAHTVRRGNTSGFAAPRYYQVDVTGGTVAANMPQAATWDPDGANVMYRFMPSVAVDRVGDMALGYSTSSSTTFPAIKYAGRLATDPLNTLSQTEQLLIQGTGTQTGSCGGTCTRWGDYSAMTLDPDGCTFWYTNMYYAASGLSFNTRIGSFAFSGCTPVGGGGSVQGTVTAVVGGAPIGGVTVALGSRTTTTDTNGNYTFSSIPAGTYPGITASDPGFATVTVSSVVVYDGEITTQDFSLSLAVASGCLTDTTQADFQSGAVSNCDVTGSPGDVRLLNGSPIDQQNTTLGTSGVGITITTWGGQAFTPAVTGLLTRIDINLFCSGCTGTTPNLTLSLRATSGGLPTGADLASATITGFGNGGVASYFTANFSSPATLTAGTQYALVIRPTANPSPGTYALTRSGTSSVGADVYAGGTRVSGATSGTVWSRPTTGGVTTDAGFKAYINSGFASSGTFTSSIKDANPDPLSAVRWGTISWTADTPAGTNVQFQAAASNSTFGPFSFVGPDGTAETFFTNPGSLARFNGSRYLKYQASFTTTDSTVTATLHDVTICFNDVVPAVATVLVVDPATAPYGGVANLSATLTASATGVSGKAVSFTLNGNKAGGGTTDGSGVATVLDASLSGIEPGSYPSGVAATFEGDSGYNTSSGTAPLTVSPANQTITFDALSSKNFGDPDFGVSASASSSLEVAFSATGNCSVAGVTVHLTGAGSCTITASQAGGSNFNPAPDVPQSFSIAKGSQTITFDALSSKNFGDPDFAVSGTTSSSLTITFAASSDCSMAGSTVHITGAGSCTIVASQAGNSNYSAASDIPQSFSIAKGSQTITFAVLSTKNFGDSDFAVSGTTSSSLAVTFTASGNCGIAGSTVHLTGAGSCTITASQAGDSNYNPAPDVPQSLTINKAVPLMTLSCNAASFDINAHACTAAITGIGNATVSGATTFTYNSNPAAPANAGTYSVSAGFTSGDGNYSDATGSGSLVIARVAPALTVNCPAGIVFDGSPHACTVAATGVGNAAVTGTAVLTYSGCPAPSAGGTYAVSATFVSGDSNYMNDTGSNSLTIAKAGQAITFGALAARTFGDPDFAISATSSSGLTVDFSASGNCSLAGSSLHVSGIGSCTVTASQAGDTDYNAATAVPRTFAINPGDDFAVAPTLPPVTVTAGQPVIVHVTITPVPATITALHFTCSGLPAKASCMFSPNPVPPGSALTDVVATITTTASTASALQRPPVGYATWMGFTGAGLIGLVVVGVRRKSRTTRKRVLLVVFSLLVLLMTMGCGALQLTPGTAGTPSGTFTVTMTGSNASFTHSTTFTLTVK